MKKETADLPKSILESYLKSMLNEVKEKGLDAALVLEKEYILKNRAAVVVKDKKVNCDFDAFVKNFSDDFIRYRVLNVLKVDLPGTKGTFLKIIVKGKSPMTGNTPEVSFIIYDDNSGDKTPSVRAVYYPNKNNIILTTKEMLLNMLFSAEQLL